MIRLERSGETRILATLVEISQALALARDLIMETKRVIENNFEGMLHLINRRCD